MATTTAPEQLGDAVQRMMRPRVVSVVAILAIVLLGLGDRVTGIELPFTILYLVPIGIATWLVGRQTGAVMSVLAGCSVAISLIDERMSAFSIGWNLGGSMALFFAASWSIDRLHGYVENERALRRSAIDQLRHAERLNVIGTLAAGVAHELGTPLNVIAGCAEFLAEDCKEASVQPRLKMILDQVDKVSVIIRRLLDFGRSNHAAPRARVDVLAVAAGAIELLSSTAKKLGCTIQLEQSAPVFVYGNAAELQQVFSNLILNGLQAMSQGEVKVRVGLAMRDRKKLAVVEVEDNGRGISLDHLDRIFDPFFTTKGIGEGTGLGLSVSYGIVRDHKGSIEVTSQVGKGSCFRVLVPASD
jgi:signal transduction histidine kinase